MDTDRIKGTLQDAAGKVQKTVGDLAGDKSDQAEGALRQVAGKAQDLYGQAKDKLPDAVSDYATNASQQAQDAARQVAGKAQDLYGQAQDRWPGVANVANDYAASAYDQTGEYARRGVSLARKEIEEYPLAAILLAGAVGYLAAVVLHSRR